MEEKQKNVENMEENVKAKEKKSIPPRTAVKGLINGFVSYGILIIFIFLTIVVFTTWFVENHKESSDYDTLKYTLPLLASFLVFFFVRATCRLSTYDLFKTCKIEKDEIDKVSNKMNFFYICLVGFSVITIILYLIVRFQNERIQVNNDMTIYSQSNSLYAQEKQNEMIEEYEANRANTLVQTIIVEMGLLLGLFSLIPNQRRLIEKYN